MKQTQYCIVSGYNSMFIKELKIEDDILQPASYSKNIGEIPPFTKKEAVALCKVLNKNDFFAQKSGVSMYYVYKLTEIIK